VFDVLFSFILRGGGKHHDCAASSSTWCGLGMGSAILARLFPEARKKYRLPGLAC
jgi:hypothetical protein